MNLAFSEADRAFQAEVKAFIAEAFDPELKGLVFQSVNAVNVFTGPDQQPWNTSVSGRDQSGGLYSPFIEVNFTWAGDVTNNGTVDNQDLLALAAAWGSVKGGPNWNEEADLGAMDDEVDIIDLLTLAGQWNSL